MSVKSFYRQQAQLEQWKIAARIAQCVTHTLSVVNYRTVLVFVLENADAQYSGVTNERLAAMVIQVIRGNTPSWYPQAS